MTIYDLITLGAHLGTLAGALTAAAAGLRAAWLIWHGVRGLPTVVNGRLDQVLDALRQIRDGQDHDRRHRLHGPTPEPPDLGPLDMGPPH